MQLKMERKTIMLIGIVILVIASIIIIKIASEKNDVVPVYFTDKTADWVGDNRNSINVEDVSIDIARATQTLSVFDGKKQEYYYYGKRVTFFSHGYYEGIPFTEAYSAPLSDEEKNGLTQEALIQGELKNIKMKIDPNMNPNDGVIDSFILARVEEKEFVFYIFVDEDWKNEIGNSNILWGDDLKDIASVNLRPYAFKEVQNGIYVDKIKDAQWFKKKTNGGIFVGEIDKSTLSIKSGKDLNATFIYIQ